MKRTHVCGELRLSNAGNTVVLNGWVQKRRDHGGLIFVDLRDRSGLVQVVFNPEVDKAAWETAESIRSEYVIAIKGKVVARPEGTINKELSTGEIEVYAEALEVLNPAKTPPFYVTDDVDVDENVRLRYRYIDLRRPVMQRNLVLRHRICKALRDYLDKQNFLEIETPMLTKSSPEGARDYLVPSRVHPGSFFALPQSPQIFKQLLMVSGMERYFQIVRCFRDEDLRADRQPEFTQIDLEMSFVEQEDVLNLVEGAAVHAFKEALGVEIPQPITRLTWHEAMDKYGSDKPDLRFGMELVDISDIAGSTEFQVFKGTVAGGGQVKGIRAEGCSKMPRREIDGLTEFVQSFGAKGLAYIVLGEDGIKSPIAKFLTEEQLQAIIARLGGKTGDILFFIADKKKVVTDALGRLRLELGKRLSLIPQGVYKLAWVIDFPMFEYSEEEKRYVAAHHPFTAPHDADLDKMTADPESVRAKSYDLVLNGVELGSGSIRIHRSDVQEVVFKSLGLEKEEITEKFGYLLEAFEHGAPPHGGMALGLDRLVMLMVGADTVRDVIAFPKTQSAVDLMMQAPSSVSGKQLKELYIKLDMPAK